MPCIRAALRRPSVWPVILHKEGCFRPADRASGLTPAIGLEQPRLRGFRLPVLSRTPGGSGSLPRPRSRSRRPSGDAAAARRDRVAAPFDASTRPSPGCYHFPAVQRPTRQHLLPTPLDPPSVGGGGTPARGVPGGAGVV